MKVIITGDDGGGDDKQSFDTSYEAGPALTALSVII
jgi:hypothetical protein